MNKKEFIQEVAKHSGMNAKDVKAVLHSFQRVLLQELIKEKEAVILDLGKLKITERASRMGVNPQTKEKIEIPAKLSPKLVTSKKLKSFSTKEITIEDFEY